MVESEAFVLGSFRGAGLDDVTGHRLKAGMSGVTLFRDYENIDSRDQVVDLCAQIQSVSGPQPALICLDQEGGQLQTLSGIVTDFPGNMALAAAGETDLAERVGYAMGLELRALGINVNYAPVCDLLTHPTNHGLSIRSFGNDPARVGSYASAMIAGLQRAGVAATAKHFPGKGAATVDTHYEQAVINRTREEFDDNELVPFRASISRGVKLMMTSHAIAPAFSTADPRPATLSPEVLTGLLRDELGFDGVTVTDALDMAAVGEGEQATAMEAFDAIRAGSDLLLTTPLMDIDALIAGLGRSLAGSALEAAVLAKSAERVLDLRRWCSEFPTPDLNVVGSLSHQALSDEVSRRSITEVSTQGREGPLEPDCVVIQPAATNLTPADTTADSTQSVATHLVSLGLSPLPRTVAHSPTPEEIERAAMSADGRDAVVVVTAAATEPAQVDLVRRIAARAERTTVIAARNPLDIGYLEDSDATRVLCSYGITESSVRAVCAVLIGEHTPEGKLPIPEPR